MMNRVMLVPVIVAAISAEATAGSGLELAYVFRARDSWQERVRLSIEVLDPAGRSTWRTDVDRIDRVEVADVDAQGLARVRRTRIDPGSRGAPFEVLVSPQGEYRRAATGDAARPGDLIDLALMRRSPTVPRGPIPPRGPRSRMVASPAAGEALQEVEQIELRETVRTGGAQVAVLALRRTGGAPARLLSVDALIAPTASTPVSVPTPGTLSVRVEGVSGVGEMRFDVTAGRLLRYEMNETIGLLASLGKARLRRTVKTKLVIERIDANGR